ncbi:phosphotransferase family protein [Lysinibacillus fusiformis]|uniref:Predicted kinase, aminoglycoside phosphotransferase (APT) family n=1 Tax=Lysinibacillus fusiformis TaxID=28031 RepID=A0A1H9AEB5_9BACI|nr:phosphotransferase [Lysinibacillus fusiformis]SCX85342.1 Predicted kinase, aminoglycoside phosphotransferase (APT) family [Lysinibacillus fusiformis]SEM80842.1 Predicted kinase, aminoglycoside phosphotransferase (APT) family [Lysinibacillus fusiformis]SEP74308.1 Predicted kinase, aminoglycoside phosphotransferase (APT) family [Lysinibacillus fusiformis]
MVVENIMNRLTSLQGYTAINKIDKGYSSDTKYVVTVDDTPYFVRLSDLAHHDKRWIEFTLLQDLELQGVQTHKAIEYMVLPDNDLSTMVMSYLIGTPADEIIPHLSDTEQFHLGLAAGKELRKIHQVKAPKTVQWETLQKEKFTNYLQSYQQDSYQIPQEAKLLSFIEEHWPLLRQRPNTLLHDDYHLGHIICHQNSFNGVIDFNGYDAGDPYHDFYNLALFSRRHSVPYCVGQINGYFTQPPDDQFWRLYALYAAMNVIATIAWTRQYDPQSFDDALARIQLILEDHAYFSSVKPLWYAEN